MADEAVCSSCHQVGGLYFNDSTRCAACDVAAVKILRQRLTRNLEYQQGETNDQPD